MKSILLLRKPALVLILAGVWSGCDRTPKTATEKTDGKAAPPASAPEKGAPPAPVNPLIVNAGRLGMAARMPTDTGLYFGSTNFQAHREALQKTQYWKTLEAFLQDSKPTAEKKKVPSELSEIEVNDFFLALGKESAPALRWIIEANHLYSEYSYRTLLTGFTGGAGKQGAFDPQAILANAATSPEMIEQMCGLLDRVELLPVLLGIKTAKPEALMDKLFPADPAKAPMWVAALKKGSLTLNTGTSLTTYEGTAGIWLTEVLRAEWLKGLGEVVTEPTVLARIKQTLDTLAAKKFSVAVGVSEGYLIVATGNDLRHVRFAATPAESLLARPDLAVAAPHAGKDVMGLFHVDAELLTAMHDERPWTPMIEGALHGLAATPSFSALTTQLDPKVKALVQAEKDFYRNEFTTANGVLWWENGAKLEISGWYSTKGIIVNRPLQFAALLDTPDAVFAGVGHSPTSVVGRAYFERWMDFLYTTTSGFIQAGIGGDNALGIYALADKGAIPELVNIYAASKTLYQKGLGTEAACVIDLKGQAPGGATAEPPTTTKSEKPAATMPRIAGVYDVVDPSALAESWQSIEAGIDQALKSVPLPMPLPPLTPISSDKNGVTTWFYPLPLGGNDLMPCASVNDKVFMLGTSKNLNEELAARLQQPPPPVTGSHYRFNVPALRTFLKNVNGTPLPGVPTEAAGTALPWLAPFGDLRLRIWQEGEVLRTSFGLEAKDVRKYD